MRGCQVSLVTVDLAWLVRVKETRCAAVGSSVAGCAGGGACDQVRRVVDSHVARVSCLAGKKEDALGYYNTYNRSTVECID
jgi:hypothetical protein